MDKNISTKIVYFTGVGNSKRIAELLKKELEKSSFLVSIEDMTDINNSSVHDCEYSYFGIVFPVYGFTSPRVVLQYVQSLPTVTIEVKAFVVATMGGKDGEGFSLVELERILSEKGYEVINTQAIVMPDSWLARKDESKETAILMAAERKAYELANKIADGKVSIQPISKWAKVLRFLPVKGLFRSFGRDYLRKLLNVDDKRCVKCDCCLKICPVSAIIKNDDGDLQWTEKCEQCMRCVNFCPRKAIKQFYVFGFTDKYKEPHFKPSRKEHQLK